MRGFFLWMVLAGVALGDLEVRAYRVPVDLEYAKYEVLPGAPFESQFFGEGDVLRDLTDWGKKAELLESEEDLAIWNETTGRMVVRGNRFRHREVVFHFSRELECQLRFGIRVVKVPEVMPGLRSLHVSDLPEGLVEIGQVGGLAARNEFTELRGAEGALLFEGSASCWGESLAYVLSMKLTCKVEGASFDFEGSLMGLNGEETVLEIGSTKGQETILVIVKGEVVFVDGEQLNDWVLGEDGRQVWKKEQVFEMRNPGYQANEKEGGKIRRRFLAPPGFLTFLRASGKEETDVRVLLMQNGVDLKEDDEVEYLQEISVLRVKVSPLALELIEGIVSTGEEIAFGMPHVNVILVESNKKLDPGAVLREELRVLSKVCHWGGYGCSVQMGALKSEFEMPNNSYRIIRTSGLIRSKNGGEVRVRGELREGAPVILQQMKVGRMWRAWVVTISRLEINDYLKEKK